MKKLLLSFAFCFFSFCAFSQNIVKDAAGNTMTDLQEHEWPVYISKTGRPYALRVSKNGTSYKQYLDKKPEKILIVNNKQIN